jgi:chromosome segregation ATPase
MAKAADHAATGAAGRVRELEAELEQARARIRRLEEERDQIRNRIDWVIDSLNNVIGE